MNGNKIIILGSSSGLPQAGRACSGYALKTGDSLSLIDCGGGVTSSFLRRGLNPLAVERIFISHTHPDHVIELPLFLQLLHLEKRREPVKLYLPADFVEPMRRFLPALYIIEDKLPFELDIVGYEEGFEYNDVFKLKAVGNKHLKAYKELIEINQLSNKMQCCSFDIEIDGKRVFYSADIATYDDIRPHLDGRDVVILESTHVALEEFIEHARSISVGRYVITHLGTDEEVGEINRMISKAGLDNVTTAVDGMEIPL
ncbi:MAG: ribonuclease Z [Candidatus Zixiibacteriota bacterium]|nr:MAG: ribonuclease Z [candidate division Zixibacteria bacterium]